ncbi:RNA-protein complex protein Nop10 [Candidatus Woesearchaeota archaeon]|nr:RNA-protein complex protein Nop10 [Candidatus Woesearchaeota archaeon]
MYQKMRHILKCKACNAYTMKEACPKCAEKTSTAAPPKYSPDDKYAKYRRIAKEGERKKESIL